MHQERRARYAPSGYTSASCRDRQARSQRGRGVTDWHRNINTDFRGALQTDSYSFMRSASSLNHLLPVSLVQLMLSILSVI